MGLGHLTSPGNIFYRIINTYRIRIEGYMKFGRDPRNIMDYFRFTNIINNYGITNLFFMLHIYIVYICKYVNM